MKDSRRSSRRSAAQLFWRTLPCALLAAVAASQTQAKPTTIAQSGAERGVTGKWEIIHVLTRNDEWTPGTLRTDDPRELGQLLNVSTDRVTFSHLNAQCKPQFEKAIQIQVPFRKLFSGRNEPGRNDTIAGRVRGRLNGQVNDYRVPTITAASASRSRQTGVQSVTLLRIQCEGARTGQPMPWPGVQNWIAQPRGLYDVLLWSREPNALIVLRRMPDTPPASDDAQLLCAQSRLSSEKAICSNAYLRMLYSYLTDPDRFIHSVEAKLASEEKLALASMAEAREACTGDAGCLRGTLLRQVHYLIALEDRYAVLPR
jgi:hypothetical protein